MKDLKKSDLSKMLGISNGHYSDLVRGRVEVGKKTAKKIGAFIGVEFYDVYKMSGHEINDAVINKAAERGCF